MKDNHGKQPVAKEETISELAERHLNDESHSTTDEELMNAKIELSHPAPPQDGIFEVDNTTLIPPIKGEPEPESDEEKDRVPNPYDVLES